MACICNRCGTQFKKKEYLLKHLKKTIVCQPKLCDTPREHLLLSYESALIKYDTHESCTPDITNMLKDDRQEVHSQEQPIASSLPTKDYDKILDSILSRGYKIIHVFGKCVNFIENYEEDLDGYLLEMRQINHKQGEEPMKVFAACLGERMIFFEGPNDKLSIL